MKVTVNQGENFVLTNEHVLRQAATQPILQTKLVLVPDRFTLQAERILLKYQPHLINSRVITFSMLYRLVAAEINQGIQPTVIDKTSAVLHLWTAIRQVQNELTWFKSSAGHYDFAEKMFNTLNQMRSSCVDFTILETQAQTVVARRKYHDINLIYQAYRKVIDQQTDSSDMLTYLVKHMAESQTVQSASVYVCGFTSLSPARLQVLFELCRCAQNVTIACSESELSAQLSKFTHYHLANCQAFTPQLQTARCETERGEANVILQKIAILLNQGVPPEDIVVLLTDFETMAPIWQVVADKYQVPVNLDVGTKLSTTSEAKYLRDLLELLANDDAENSIAVLFNQNSGVKDEALFALDNQIVKSNLRARHVAEIKKLTATKNITELCQQLKSLTTNEKIHNILDQIANHCAGQSLGLRDFINLFWTLCCATKVSNIPLYLDRILIAPVNDWVPSHIQYLFIANCTAENFPQGQADDDILQEADLVGTQITPTPTLQRERNYRRAELLKTVAVKQVTLSGINEEFDSVAYQAYHQFQFYHDSNPISVGHKLFFPTQRVNTTMLEKYYDCPRLNFWQNGLKLRPRPIYRLAADVVGTAIHTALEKYYLDPKRDLDRAVQAGLQKLDFDYPPLTQNIAKEIRFILQELERIFATGQFKLPTQIETPVSRPLAHGLTLVGRVDRIDLADLGNQQRAILVIDYKTGNVSGSIPKNIYLGNKLQLPVYGSALSTMGRLAGAGYLPLSKGYANTDKKTFTFNGFVNEDLRDLLPSELLSPGARCFISEETIAKLCAHANHLVDEAVEQIIAGRVEAFATHKNICKYCYNRPFCPRATGDYRDSDIKVTYKTFAEVKDGNAN